MGSHILLRLNYSCSGFVAVARNHHILPYFSLRQIQPFCALSRPSLATIQCRFLSMAPQQKKNSSISMIKQLRAITNAPIIDCREALVSVATENENVDIDVTLQAAMGWLREKGRLRAANKAGRIAREGLIGVHIHQDKKSAAVMELNCETDFVAKSEPFQKVCVEILNSVLSQVSSSNEHGIFSIPVNDVKDVSCLESITQLSGQVGEKIELRRFYGIKISSTSSSVVCYMHNKVNSDIPGLKDGVGSMLLGRIASVVLIQSKVENPEIKNEEVGSLVAMHVVAESPTYLNRDTIPTEELQKLKDTIQQDLVNQGGKKKPDHIIKRIIDGKLKKFYQQNMLLEQKFSLGGEAENATNVQSYCNEKQVQPIDFLRLKVGES